MLFLLLLPAEQPAQNRFFQIPSLRTLLLSLRDISTLKRASYYCLCNFNFDWQFGVFEGFCKTYLILLRTIWCLLGHILGPSSTSHFRSSFDVSADVLRTFFGRSSDVLCVLRTFLSDVFGILVHPGYFSWDSIVLSLGYHQQPTTAVASLAPPPRPFQIPFSS